MKHIYKYENIILPQMSLRNDNPIKEVPYMPGMGWRIMDVIDPENELDQLYERIDMMDTIDDKNK